MATVLALTNNNAAPYPTMAEMQVFDSELDPLQLQFDSAQRKRPVIVVYTDGHHRRSLDENAGGGPWRRKLELSIDIKLVEPAVHPESGEQTIGVTWSTPQMEGLLDLLEHQVHAALFGPGPWASLWGALTGRKLNFDSDRDNDTDLGASRLAERMIAIDCELLRWEDPLPCVVPSDDAVALGVTGLIKPGALPSALQALLDAIDRAGASSPYVTQVTNTIKLHGLPPHEVTAPALRALRMAEAGHGDLQNIDGTPTARGPRPGGLVDATFS
ncbi:MAG: hypothetical protein AAFO79_00175 [Pseudomonadota bacterium]